MELVELLREQAADFHQAGFDNTAKKIREAADLLEEALGLLESVRYSLYPDLHTEMENEIDQLLTKARGENPNG